MTIDLRPTADTMNPYKVGTSREAWRHGFLLGTNFGARGSAYDRIYREGRRARKAHDRKALVH